MKLRARLLLIAIVVSMLVAPLQGSTWAQSLGDQGVCHPALQDGNEHASRMLAELRPFAPRNLDRFYSFDRPEWRNAAPIEPLPGPGLSDAETRDALRVFLDHRFPCSSDRVHDGMAVYSDPVARQKLPEPTLRAALAALTGTIGEPAIAFLLFHVPVSLVHFGVPIDPDTGLPGRSGAASVSPDGTRSIVIDRRYRFAPFGAFSALLVHEALHAGVDEDVAGLPEEATATAIEALVYMQMLLTDPALASLPDDLTRGANNHVALVRLNSGPAGTDRLTIFVPNSGVNIDPLATEPLSEFYEYYARYSAPDDPEFRERTTQGNWLLQAILVGLGEHSSQDAPADPDFDAATLEFIDQHQDVLSPSDLIAVACILELNVSCH